MKKIFVLSVLTSVAMICACQKKDSTAQEQFTQPKTELGAREEALAERLNSLEEKVNGLDQRVKELAEKEKATMNAKTSRTDGQGQTADPAQMQAERDSFIQQLSTMRDSSQEDAEKEREIRRAQELPGLGQLQGQQQLGADELEKLKQRKLELTGASPTPQ